MLALLLVVGLLVAWLVTSGGGNDTHHDSGGADGKNPAPSITPGPSSSGPAISQHPGGRDESSDGGSSGASGSTGGGSGSAGAGSAGAGGGGGAGGSGGGGAQTGGGSGGYQVPAGSSLPTCTSGAVKLTLHTPTNDYDPGENPRLELTAKNSSDTDCKIDLGPKNAVVTITQADGDKQLWASDDCPSGGSLFLRVPAGSSVTHTVTWNRKPSAPDCATPPANSAAAGTYLAEAKAPGFAKTQTSFVLNKD